MFLKISHVFIIATFPFLTILLQYVSTTIDELFDRKWLKKG